MKNRMCIEQSLEDFACFSSDVSNLDDLDDHVSAQQPILSHGHEALRTRRGAVLPRAQSKWRVPGTSRSHHVMGAIRKDLKNIMKCIVKYMEKTYIKS